MGIGILSQKSVKNGVGNAVRDLVGMPFGDGFGRKVIFAFGGNHENSFALTAEERLERRSPPVFWNGSRGNRFV